MRRLLRSWLWRIPVEQEVDEELAFHVEMRTRELVRAGMSPTAARLEAVARLGSVRHLKETCRTIGRKRDRAMRMAQRFEELRDDVVVAFRQLRSAPAFTLVAVLTLALGIGANSAIFALVDAALLRPLPFGDPDRLVALGDQPDAGGPALVSPLNLVDWNTRNTSFDQIAGFVPDVGAMVMTGADGNAETVSRQWVTAGIFDVLGVRAITGRTFLTEDDQQRANVVVMSEQFWRTRFGGDASVVGREIRLDGTMFTVVGVAPADFQLLDRSSLWAMRSMANLPPRARGFHWLQAVGRLKAGVTLDAASADLTRVTSTLAAEYPQTNLGRRPTIAPLHALFVGGDLRQTSVLFLGVVGIVLLICCANVASLLMARASARARELAVRAALGAGRGRIVRQLLTESVVLSLLGGALGVGFGAAILSASPALLPEGLLPAAVTLAFDARVVAFCFATALLVGIVFGLTPAWQASRVSTRQMLSDDTRTTSGSGGRVRMLLVVAEVATAVLLLFGGGLLLRTLMAVENFDRGFRAASVLSMLVDPLGSKYPTPEALQQFYAEVEAELRKVPGVQDVAWTGFLPLDSPIDDGVSFEVAGEPPVEASRRPMTGYQAVSHTYFSTLDLPILAGRSFDQRDHRTAAPVCIVNEAFAERRGRSPVGAQLALRSINAPDDEPQVCEVVGIARQVKGRPDETGAYLQVYVPFEQNLADDTYLVVRPRSGAADALTPAVRAAFGRIDREQLVGLRDVTTLEDIAWAATSRHRFRAVMVLAFAGLALVLAMVGVFGILGYNVQQRVRDFGLRRALGATTADVVRLAVRDAARMIGSGAIIGLGLSAFLGRGIASMLFGVEPLDPLTFAMAGGVLLLAAAVAVAGPVWRATRIDPIVAMRTT